MDAYLLQYNNYFNRIVKKENSLNDYIENRDYDVLDNTNFNINDGVSTSHVFRWCNDWIPDYVIIASENHIMSRWFIIEWVKQCRGQYRASLKRDVIVDNYEAVISSPIFVQKAHLKDTDPMIFNPEGQSYNQIKTSETLLDGGKKCVWAIIYAASNQELTETIHVPGTTTIPSVIDIQTNITNWQYYRFYSNKGIVINDLNFSYGIKYTIINHSKKWSEFYAKNGSNTQTGLLIDSNTYPVQFWNNRFNEFISAMEEKISTNHDDLYSKSITFLTNTNNKYISKNDFENFKNTYDGKYIKDSSNRYFIVRVKQKNNEYWSEDITSGQLYTGLSGIVNEIKEEGIVSGTPNSNTFYLASENSEYFQLELDEIFNIDAIFKLGDITNVTEDSPFKTYAIPIPTEDYIWVKDSSPDYDLPFKVAKQTMLSAVSSLIKTLGSKVYDVQILPYCIYDQYFSTNQKINTYLINQNYITYFEEGGIRHGFAVSIPSSKYTANIFNQITNNEEIKIQNECNKYRLVSPNYAGEFEFSLAKNGGSVDFFTVSCDFKPYQPVVIVQPHFNGLYGQNFNDARGLILSGDLSVPSEQSQWINYVNNNKNYEQAFNRSIEHMDYVNKVSEVGDVAGAIVGALGGGASGALTGNLIGGNMKSGVAGGIAGGIASGIAGAIDVSMSKALRAENKDYAIDNYNYQLGNIKARPYTINKLGCLNNNFKFFPFIEYYTCTDKEKEALRNKIKYSGMTVNRIGTISEFLDPNEKHFIKGQFIRLEELGDDYHMATVICEELMKGEFI